MSFLSGPSVETIRSRRWVVFVTSIIWNGLFAAPLFGWASLRPNWVGSLQPNDKYGRKNTNIPLKYKLHSQTPPKGTFFNQYRRLRVHLGRIRYDSQLMSDKINLNSEKNLFDSRFSRKQLQGDYRGFEISSDAAQF